jgi:ribonuclease HI
MSGEPRPPQKRPAPGEWLRVYSDGGSRGNPGPAGIGAIAMDTGGRVLIEVCEFLGKATNNVAEYYALIRVLEESRDLGFERLRAHTDSQLVANQVTGGYRVKNQGLKPLAARAKALLDEYREVEVQYIPREKNIECDALANKAMDEGLLGRKEPLLTQEEDSLF